ncbi:HPF/RaiA family ribosome-associated protein [Opitutus terrae]|uniref:Sigma 54 modulation protein/ribosomal protein S30EA n=1 Tax=Opitutus terrae (strain DSM 11246 / JCM 15787 / PB90-1) TaxID=452637 RepID=B1ZS48_OPITP|nr:HPF/RaiA family ribosome-associated protein [Opitutus terrae]ACB74724.1 hypothetical protein Oter_1439 [Opitutus terrae PB90-1]
MKLSLKHVHVRPTDSLDSWVEEGLSTLRPLLAIDEAHVRLEHDAAASPAYRVTVHLVVPGPDLRADAVDHTLRTAFAKVLGELRARAEERVARRRRLRRGVHTLDHHRRRGPTRRRSAIH